MKKEIKVLGLVVVAVLFSTQLAYAKWQDAFTSKTWWVNKSKSVYQRQLCPVGRGFKSAGRFMKGTGKYIALGALPLAWDKKGRGFVKRTIGSKSWWAGKLKSNWTDTVGGRLKIARINPNKSKQTQEKIQSGLSPTGNLLFIGRTKTVSISGSAKANSSKKNLTGLMKKYTVGGLDFWANY